jgi:lysophospholipase L1-like esterase
MRKVKDAYDLNDKEKIYFRGHAAATYTSDGKTVEQNLSELSAEVGKKVDADKVATINGQSLVGGGNITIEGGKGEKGDKGDQGNSGYTGAADELEVVNNLTQGGATAALSAEMGRVLSAEVGKSETIVSLQGVLVKGLVYDNQLRPADESKYFGSMKYEVSGVAEKVVRIATNIKNQYYKAFFVLNNANQVVYIPTEVSSVKNEYEVDLSQISNAYYVCVLVDVRTNYVVRCDYIGATGLFAGIEGLENKLNDIQKLNLDNRMQEVEVALNGGKEGNPLVGEFKQGVAFNGSVIQTTSSRSSFEYDVSFLRGKVKVTTSTNDQAYFYTWTLTDDKQNILASSGRYNNGDYGNTNKVDGGVGEVDLSLYVNYKYLYVLAMDSATQTSCIPLSVGLINNEEYFSESIAELSEFKEKAISKKDTELVYPNRWIVQVGRQSCFYKEELVKIGKKCQTSIAASFYADFKNIATGTPSAKGTFVPILYSVTNETLEYNELTTDIIVVEKPNVANVKMLCFGDSFTDNGYYLKGIKDNMAEDSINAEFIGLMDGGKSGNRLEGIHSENMSGGKVGFISNADRGVNVLLNVVGVSVAPTTIYPGTTYADANGFVWACKGYKLDANGNGFIKLGRVIMDDNYAGQSIKQTTAEEVLAASRSFPISGKITKRGSLIGDATISYNSFEVVYENPIYNPQSQKISLSWYLNKYGFSTPNVVVLAFGINDLTGIKRTDDEIREFIAENVSVIDSMLAEYPALKIIMVANPPCAHINTNTQTLYQEQNRRYNMSRYYELLTQNVENASTYKNNVFVVPAYMFVDREKAYDQNQIISPCKRYDEEVEYGRDFIHCSETGMYQISDALVPYIYYAIQQ